MNRTAFHVITEAQSDGGGGSSRRSISGMVGHRGNRRCHHRRRW